VAFWQRDLAACVDGLLPHKAHFGTLGGSVLDQETVRRARAHMCFKLLPWFFFFFFIFFQKQFTHLVDVVVSSFRSFMVTRAPCIRFL
jgi:hypothetical protein